MNFKIEGNLNEAIELLRILNSLEFSIPLSKHSVSVFMLGRFVCMQ
jgi:hypothetical protein